MKVSTSYYFSYTVVEICFVIGKNNNLRLLRDKRLTIR